ncbi:MAG: hypothetical protein Q9225_006304 [Loekoesia sp. 1 TL-2023]
MAYTRGVLLFLIALVHFAASYALAPPSPVPDDLLRLDQPQLATRDPATALDYSESDSILQSALDAPDPLSVLRNATQPLNYLYECDGDRFGTDLPLLSCIDALKLILDVNAKFRFGPRTEGRVVNFKTPYRFLSNDGLCAVDFERHPGVITDYARGKDLRVAGDRRGIDLIIRTYTPHVQCSSSTATAPTFGTCLNILDSQVPNYRDVKVFGRSGEPNIDQALPQTFVDSLSRRCSLVVNTRGPVDSARWYDIWGAATAIDAMCGRQLPNKGGVATGLGEHGNIFAVLKSLNKLLEGLRSKMESFCTIPGQIRKGNTLRTSNNVEHHQPTAQSMPTSPVELVSGPVGWTHKLDNPTLVWITAFPHAIGSTPSHGTNVILLSRDFADLQTARRKLRKPGEDPGYDKLYGRPLHRARGGILGRREKPEKTKWWPKPKAHSVQWVTSIQEARRLDDAQDQSIADAFADHLPPINEWPPSLAEDLEFNLFYKNGAFHDDERAQFPLVFRAMVPSDWRGLSPHPADEHNVHVLELTESVKEDLTRFWFKTWDYEWPEPDLYRSVIKRMRSWSSRYEVDVDDERFMRSETLQRASTVGTEKDVKVRGRGKVRKSLQGFWRRFEGELRQVGAGKERRRRMYDRFEIG